MDIYVNDDRNPCGQLTSSSFAYLFYSGALFRPGQITDYEVCIQRQTSL